MTHRFRQFIGTLSLMALAAIAGGQTLREYQAKGAFLVNFARFIEWPLQAFDGPDSPLTICFAGDDWILGEIESVTRHRRAGNREIRLRRAADTTDCHLLFVTATEPLESRLRTAKSFTVTVGEHPEFLKAGGHIKLFMDGNHIRFSIAKTVIRSPHFRFSSQLLALAESFKDRPEQ